MSGSYFTSYTYQTLTLMTDPALDSAEGAQPARRNAGISDSAALLELSTILNSSQSLDFILGNVLLTAMGKLMLTKGVVLLDSGSREYRLRAIKGLIDRTIDGTFVLTQDWPHFLHVADIDREASASLRAFVECCEACGISALAPMLLDGNMVGIVGVGPKIGNTPFEHQDSVFLDSIAAVAASAVHNAVTIESLRGSNRRLDSKVQEMNTLFELSSEMNATFDEQTILRTLGYALMGQLRAMRYAVLVDSGNGCEAVLVKHPKLETDRHLFGEITTIERPVTLDAARAVPETFEGWAAAAGFHVLIPMRTQKETRGMMCLGERFATSGYGANDIEYLNALANITITALENARLVREMVEKRQLEREISLARGIQKGLLPAQLPSPQGYDIAAINDSSLQVGGDYYDAITLSANEYMLAIGDVSGKGIPASLLMANVQAALRAIAPLRLPLTEATERLNAIVFANTGSDKFITFFWGVLNTQRHSFTFVNAGHNPPYLVRADGSVYPLSTGGLILGVLDDPPPYESETVQLAPGDTIVTYTDGVNEALSKDMIEFGNERLEALLVSLRSESTATIIERVRADIIAHTIGAPQSDDITMLVLRRER